MSLNDDAGPHLAALNAVFRLARGAAVDEAELESLPPELVQLATQYASKDFKENYTTMNFDILQDMAGYLRIQSALQDFTQNKITDQAFIQMINGSRVPSYLRNYYLAIVHYRKRKVEKSMKLFSLARVQLDNMIVKYGHFVDASIRGIVSARSFSEFEEICLNASPEQNDTYFPYILDARQPSARICHIVGCDEKYWLSYRDLFLKWASSLSKIADIWVNCTSFSEETIAQLRRDAPFLFVSIDTNSFTNKIPYYTMTRFILAEKLARSQQYEAITCSDIDIFVESDRYEDVVNSARPGGTAMYRPWNFPWRSTDAKFSIWKGAEGRRMLLWIVAYYCDVYRPEITARNRQWWIDQYALAMLAELGRGAYPAWSLEPSHFNVAQQKTFPMTSPAEQRMSKGEFAAHYARADAT